MRILYVEDNAVDADLVRRELARHLPEAAVEVAATLAQARERLAVPERFELVLTDLQLPDGHGLELCAEIRRSARPLAVVALTSQGDEDTAVAALRAGADDYLAKRSDYPARLPATLQAALARFRAESARRARGLQVLYAEPERAVAEATRAHLERAVPHLRLEIVGNAGDVLARLPTGVADACGFDLLLLGLDLPDAGGIDVLKVVREERGLDLAAVLLSRQGSEDLAAQALRLGATDYVARHPGYLHALPAVLENAHHRVMLLREQAALRDSQARLAGIVESAMDAILSVDDEHRIVAFNPAAETMFRCPRAKALGETIDRFVPERLAAAHRAHIERFKAESRGGRMMVGLRHPASGLRADGEEFPIEASVSTARLAGGHLHTVILRDVTHLRRAEAELQQLNTRLEQRVAARTAELEATNLELEAFSYSVSHDLRAPLRAIDGFSALIERDHAASLPPEARRYLGLVRQSALRMDRLIEDLLAFSRTARQALLRSSLDPTALVRHCLDELREEIERRGIELRVDPLPPCAADAALLRQVYANLLGNAVKYTRHQAHPRIEVGSRQDGDETVYFVRDNGAGFDMRHATDRIFGVFQRLHREDEFEGTGVGLAIVKRIVQRHGGRIWAEAEPGRGASFYFTLGSPALR